MLNTVMCRHLNKNYGEKSIIKNFNHVFNVGSHAVIGPNGTGKSTLLKLLAGSEKPDAGEIEINHISLVDKPENAKNLLAYVPDQSFIYPFLTGKEFLKLVIKLRGPVPEETLHKYIEGLNLSDMLNKYFSELSLGTQKKLMLIAALIYNPVLLIMDEPSNGLDSTSKKFLIEQINKRRTSCIILYATHDQELIRETHSTVIKLDNSFSTTEGG